MPSPIVQFLSVDNSISEIHSLFALFLKYWEVCNKRGVGYTSLQVVFITAEIYQILSDCWRNKNWPIEEIFRICDALSVCCSCINPNNFLNDKTAYIFHIKNCFLLAEI